MENQQAGWYSDPSGNATKLRYWDGTQWTNDFADAQPPVGYGNAYSDPAYYSQVADNESDRMLRLVAFVFCIISTVSVGWLIVPLIWMIPMSVICWGTYKGTKANTTAFGVCTLIFVNFIGGILLLISRKDA